MSNGTKEAGLGNMDTAGFDRLMKDVIAAGDDESKTIMDLLLQNHSQAEAIGMLSSVLGLRELGYPIPEAVATAEEIYHPASEPITTAEEPVFDTPLCSCGEPTCLGICGNLPVGM